MPPPQGIFRHGHAIGDYFLKLGNQMLWSYHADTNRHDLAPEAAGLLAASLGLSRMYRDDLVQLDAGMLLYDAFYRWARDATDEGHDWPSALGQS